MTPHDKIFFDNQRAHDYPNKYLAALDGEMLQQDTLQDWFGFDAKRGRNFYRHPAVRGRDRKNAPVLPRWPRCPQEPLPMPFRPPYMPSGPPPVRPSAP